MKAIEEQLGPETVQHILQQCNMTVQCGGIVPTSSSMVVTSDSETNDTSSSLSLSSSDEEYNL